MSQTIRDGVSNWLGARIQSERAWLVWIKISQQRQKDQRGHTQILILLRILIGTGFRDGLLDGGYIIKERRNPENLPPINVQ